ncbi:MAG: hypothetical protein LC737_01330 [Chloroflexi bacterium]|nr:hypothetical protein [Chloroflexota bacterium]
MFDAAMNAIAPYLAPDERIEWQGRSRGRAWGALSATGGILLAVFVTLALILFAISMLLGATIPPSDSSGIQVFVILPLIFLMVGLGVGLPLLLAGLRTPQAIYFTTTHAAIIYGESRWIGRRITVVSLANLSTISVIENRDGTGSLIFGQNAFAGSANARYGSSQWADAMPAFWNIDQPRELYQRIRAQMHGRDASA